MRKLLFLALLLCSLVFAGEAWAIDPDGTTITAPSGTLSGLDGTWGWGAPSVAGLPDYKVTLNGSPVGPLNGALTMITWDGGRVAIADSGGHWWQIRNGQLIIGHNPFLTPLTSNVHNAPGWIHSKSDYATGARVNNGLGWNEGTGKFVSYSLLRAYQLISGACTTAASGGPTGTASDITDGTCHWKYLSDTDYVTLTGWGMDSPAWAAGPYGYSEFVASPDTSGDLTLYRNMNTNGCVINPTLVTTPHNCGYNVAGSCMSTVAPPNAPAGDNCNWQPLTKLMYSSGLGKSPPKQRWIGINYYFHLLQGPYKADLWNDRQYVVGQNGEASTDFLSFHHDSDNHNANTFNTGLSNPCGDDPANGGGAGHATYCQLIVNAAPNESFSDKLAANPSLPLRYDPSYGVSLVGAWLTNDDYQTFRRLQMYNPTFAVVWGSGRDANQVSVESSIIEVGTPSASISPSAPISVGASPRLSNSLIITHGPGALGWFTIYPGAVINSAIVNPEGTGYVAHVMHRSNWFLTQGNQIYNSVFSGFTHNNAAEYNTIDNIGFTYNTGIGKGTIPAGVFTTSPLEPYNTEFVIAAPDGSNNTFDEIPITGATYSVNPSSLFMGANDYRINPSGPLRAAGTAVGDINPCAEGGSPYTGTAVGPCYFRYDTPDISGTTRPSTSSDIGPWQTSGSPPTTHTLTVSGPTNGTVTGTGSISCPSACVNTLVDGSTVTLTANPTSGYHFTSWGGACTGQSNPCSFVIGSNLVASVNFAVDASPNPVANRIARLTVRSPPSVQGPPPQTGLLQMPAGITGSQTVDVGTGPNTITMQFSKTHVEDADNHFVLYISADGNTYTQITDTVNPMTVTGGYTNPDRFYAPQTFILHGNWGPTDVTTKFIKIVEATAGSLNSLYTDQMRYNSVDFTYVGPSTKGGTPSQGYTNYNGAAISPVVWSSCYAGIVPAPPGGGSGDWIDCPPVYNATPSQIAGATVDGVGVATGTLAQIIDPLGGGHDVVLPAGHFFGTGSQGQFDQGTQSGNRVHGQGQGATVIDGRGITPAGFKGLFDFETYVIALTDLTVTGGQIGGNADNPNNSSNAGCIFMEWAGYLIDNVELTKCQDGIRGHSVGPGSTVSNSYLHDNGSRTGFTHELYLAGGDHFFTLNNTKIVAGDRPGYALKVRFQTVVNGGYFSSCTDPTAQTCAGLLDFPNGNTIAIQGMNTAIVGGTVHTGDVLTMTFQHLSDTPIVVTSTVAAGPPTAQVATNALLAALQADASLASAGWAFHASMPVGGGSTIPNAIDLYAPYRLSDWTITPTVTGGGATTTLTKTMNPVTLVLNSNALVPNGSTQIIKCQEEAGPGTGGATCIMNLDNVIIDNRNANAPRIAVGQWDSTPGIPGTVLNITNCVYTGGIAPQITSNWATVNGSCTAAP